MTDGRILVVHAGRYGSTAGVADAIAGELRRCGATVDLSPASEGSSLDPYETVIIGSAVYWGRPLPEAVRFIGENRKALADRCVAYFLLCLELTRDGQDADRRIPVSIDPRFGGPPRDPARLSCWERTHLVSTILDPLLEAAPEMQPVSIGILRGRLDYRRLRFAHFVVMKPIWWLFRRAPEGDFRNWAAIRPWASGLCPSQLPGE
jgi:menaquinone-dependent protoporphyrinogen oxidase